MNEQDIFQEAGIPKNKAVQYCFDYIEQHYRTEFDVRHIINVNTMQHLPVFKANGKSYRVINSADGIGIARYNAMRLMMQQALFDMSLGEIYQRMDKVKGLLNQQQWADAAYNLLDTMKSVSTASKEFPYALRACCLFIVQQGEDVSILPSDDLCEEKIADWTAEKIHEADFFFHCVKYSGSWNERLADIIAQIQLKI